MRLVLIAKTLALFKQLAESLPISSTAQRQSRRAPATWAFSESLEAMLAKTAQYSVSGRALTA